MNMNQVNIGKMTLGVATPVVKYPMLILFCSSFALGSPRDRVGAPRVIASDLSVQFILDTRARELCGEYTRWYDLKRMGKLNRSYLMNTNPDVGQFFKDGVHGLRPIPQGQMDAVSNPNEFLQNNGY